MKAKVRNFKLFSDGFCSIRGTHLVKEDTTHKGELNIVFDENMYIDYLGFAEECQDMLNKYIHEYLTIANTVSIENKLNLLLLKYRNNKMLFLESDPFFREREKNIILYKDEYFDEY